MQAKVIWKVWRARTSSRADEERGQEWNYTLCENNCKSSGLSDTLARELSIRTPGYSAVSVLASTFPIREGVSEGHLMNFCLGTYKGVAGSAPV